MPKENSLQCPAIDSFEETIADEKITFVRVANHFGWWVCLAGKFYGDWVKSDTPEAFDILRNQAIDTLNKLKK